MSGLTPWQRLQRELAAAMDRYGAAQAECTGRVLKDIRWAVERYGQQVDIDGFDELGEPIEVVDDDGVEVDPWKKKGVDALQGLEEVEE